MMAFISIAPEEHWEHMSGDIAQAIKILQKSGLDYELGAMGTSIEGDPEAVFDVLKAMHMAMRDKSRRVATFIKIDDQVNRPMGRMKAKLESLKEKLA